MAQWISALAAVVSACGVLLAFWQLRLMKTQSVTAFEDNFAREYRELAARLPARAILGEALTEEEHNEAMDEFIHYIDLSNEQVFLRQCKRISRATWENWQAGIKASLQRPAFKRAWQEIKDRSDNFSELRSLEKERFDSDPAEWKKAAPA